eukprot:4686761-Prymnesium_polylepis.2
MPASELMLPRLGGGAAGASSSLMPNNEFRLGPSQSFPAAALFFGFFAFLPPPFFSLPSLASPPFAALVFCFAFAPPSSSFDAFLGEPVAFAALLPCTATLVALGTADGGGRPPARPRPCGALVFDATTGSAGGDCSEPDELKSSSISRSRPRSRAFGVDDGFADDVLLPGCEDGGAAGGMAASFSHSPRIWANST